MGDVTSCVIANAPLFVAHVGEPMLSSRCKMNHTPFTHWIMVSYFGVADVAVSSSVSSVVSPTRIMTLQPRPTSRVNKFGRVVEWINDSQS